MRSVLPNEGYDEAHFDAYIERWSALAHNLAQGLVVSVLARVSDCLLG